MPASKHVPKGTLLVPIRVMSGVNEIVLVDWDEGAGRAIIGPSQLGNLWLKVQSGGSFSFRAGSGQLATLSGTTFELSTQTSFAFGNGVSNPFIGVTATPGATGTTLGIAGQAAVTQGGDIFVRPGTGVTGGEGYLATAGGTKRTRWNDTGMAFFGTAPIAKPAVTGSRADPEAALANLLTALANLGLITNSTSA